MIANQRESSQTALRQRKGDFETKTRRIINKQFIFHLIYLISLDIWTYSLKCFHEIVNNFSTSAASFIHYSRLYMFLFLSPSFRPELSKFYFFSVCLKHYSANKLNISYRFRGTPLPVPLLNYKIYIFAIVDRWWLWVLSHYIWYLCCLPRIPSSKPRSSFSWGGREALRGQGVGRG